RGDRQRDPPRTPRDDPGCRPFRPRRTARARRPTTEGVPVMTKLDVKLGLQIPLFDFPRVAPDKLFERVSDIARTAEASGFDSVWVMDHFEQILGDPAAPLLEGYVVLAGIAARTERVNLGTLVTVVLYSNPAVLAKMVTSLDVLSAGRAVLGLGASWNESEQQNYGIESVTVVERMDRLDEALEICR